MSDETMRCVKPRKHLCYKRSTFHKDIPSASTLYRLGLPLYPVEAVTMANTSTRMSASNTCRTLTIWMPLYVITRDPNNPTLTRRFDFTHSGFARYRLFSIFGIAELGYFGGPWAEKPDTITGNDVFGRFGGAHIDHADNFSGRYVGICKL